MTDNDAVAKRLQEYEGEVRANLLRAVAIAAFYLVELADYRGFRLGLLEMPKVESVDKSFHMAMTAIAAAWLVASWGVHAFLRRRVFPPALKYLSTGLDVVYLTAALLVADGPRSPLVVAYLLLPALAALRLSLPLVRFATAAAASGYLVLLGHARWFRPASVVPRYHQALFLLTLLLSGVLLGQVLRRARPEPAGA